MKKVVSFISYYFNLVTTHNSWSQIRTYDKHNETLPKVLIDEKMVGLRKHLCFLPNNQGRLLIYTIASVENDECDALV